MAKEASAPNATISDTTERTALSIDAPTATSCNQDMMKTDALTTQSTLVQTPLNKNHHLHPPSESPHQKPLRNHASPNWQSSNSSSSSNGIRKGGRKGKKPEWKRFQDNVDRSLSQQFREMDEKYDQELKDFSLASDYQEQYDDTAYKNINGEPSHSHDFWFSNGISNIAGW